MRDAIQSSSYHRGNREFPSVGINTGKRQEPNIDEIRLDLAKDVSKLLSSFGFERFGALASLVSEQVINEFLLEFEINLVRTKRDLNLVLQELLNRIIR